MPVYKWQRRPTTHFGEVWFPIAQVELQTSQGRSRGFALQIDSGAVVSLLRRSTADLLGITLESGRRIALTSVGNATTGAYVHAIRTRFNEGLACDVRFAIADTEEVPNLLGRLDVFDSLQVYFDATLQVTTVAPVWLDAANKRLWDVVADASEHIASRWRDNPLPAPGDEAAGQLLRRGEQLFATAAGLMRLPCTWEAPLVVRALFEVSLQFEYLIQSPAQRGQLYLDYAKVTRYERVQRIVENAHGLIGQRIANSPLRAEGEIRNKQDYDSVERNYRKGKGGHWHTWHCKSVAQLASELGRRGEYDVWYSSAAGWSHGDLFATQSVSLYPGSGVEQLFQACLQFFGRMLYSVIEAKRMIIAAEPFELLRACLQNMD
ncbi:MAG: DUF5677 domain-containing protein [Planctomycetota bacterium]